jgi:uncharacterized RDD family membrane protein YckC
MTTPENPYASPAIPADLQASSAIAFGHGELATRGKRFLGALIDGLIMMPLAFTAGLVLGVGLILSGIDVNSVEFKAAAGVGGVVIGGGLFLVLNGYLLATRGQTIGKYLVKTQIVSNEGQQVSLAMLILRRYLPFWIIGQFPLVGPVFLLADCLAIFRPERKCFHDDLAGTKVIQLGP